VRVLIECKGVFTSATVSSTMARRVFDVPIIRIRGADRDRDPVLGGRTRTRFGIDGAISPEPSHCRRARQTNSMVGVPGRSRRRRDIHPVGRCVRIGHMKTVPAVKGSGSSESEKGGPDEVGDLAPRMNRSHQQASCCPRRSRGLCEAGSAQALIARRYKGEARCIAIVTSPSYLPRGKWGGGGVPAALFTRHLKYKRRR